jgi:hypothetical protein
MLQRILAPVGTAPENSFDTTGRPLPMATLRQDISATRGGGIAFDLEELVLILYDIDFPLVGSKKSRNINVIDFEFVALCPQLC